MSAATGLAPNWSPLRGRALWYPRALMAALGLTFVVFTLSGTGSDAISGRVGGDYPAFYAAGQIVLDDPRALYEPGLQEERQQELFGESDSDGFLYFAYPPYVALAYAPLSEVPYRASYVIDVVLMVGLVALALHQLRTLIPLVDQRFEQVLYASILFYPMFRGVTAGQTTAVVLCLLAVGVRALADRRDPVAGLAFAALLFKPQYALALLGVSLLIGRWKAVAAGALGTVALYLTGAAMQGPGWLGPWIDQARWFTEFDAEINGDNAISWLGAAESVLGVGSPGALAIGWSLAVATSALLAWVWWRDGGRHLAALAALTAPGLLLLAPHAMFYDAGLLIVALVVLVDDDRRRFGPAAVVFGASFLQALGSPLGVAPNFVLTVGVFCWVLTALFDVRSGRVRGPSGEMSASPAVAS